MFEPQLVEGTVTIYLGEDGPTTEGTIKIDRRRTPERQGGEVTLSFDGSSWLANDFMNLLKKGRLENIRMDYSYVRNAEDDVRMVESPSGGNG